VYRYNVENAEYMTTKRHVLSIKKWGFVVERGSDVCAENSGSRQIRSNDYCKQHSYIFKLVGLRSQVFNW